MDDFLLSTCGPDPISVTDAVAAVQGYATAKRWLFIRTPSHADGHWVQVPAYRFDAFDAQPADTDLGSLTWSIFAAEGLHGVERDQEKRFAFHREIEALLPLVERAVGHADGRPFWELPARSAAEGPVVDALDAARRLSDPDRGSAVLHHHRPDLFPLLSRHTVRVTAAVASAQSTTPWMVIHRDLTGATHQFGSLEAAFSRGAHCSLTRLRLHDLLTWLIASQRWADALREGGAGRQ